jgi:hypothetical protein
LVGPTHVFFADSVGSLFSPWLEAHCATATLTRQHVTLPDAVTGGFGFGVRLLSPENRSLLAIRQVGALAHKQHSRLVLPGPLPFAGCSRERAQRLIPVDQAELPATSAGDSKSARLDPGDLHD